MAPGDSGSVSAAISAPFVIQHPKELFRRGVAYKLLRFTNRDWIVSPSMMILPSATVECFEFRHPIDMDTGDESSIHTERERFSAGVVVFCGSAYTGQRAEVGVPLDQQFKTVHHLM